MAMVNETRIEFRRFELDSAMREYNELWDAWKVVEAKAQPLSTIAAVFLAGVFTYASQTSAHVSMCEKVLLWLLALSLVTSTIQALRSIWVVDVDSPHLGSDAKVEIDTLLSPNRGPLDNLHTRYENLLSDTSRRWFEACDDIRPKLVQKVHLLKRSLQCLALSAILTLVLIGTSLVGRAAAGGGL